MNRFAKTTGCLLFAVACLVAASQAQAQSTRFSQGAFYGMGNGTGYNPAIRATHIPGVAVIKPSGVYRPVGGGYYQNPNTGNVYNPRSGSYTQGRNVTFRPGMYQSMGNGTGYNPATRSTHIPGVAVIKPSGVYRPIGGGYYQNPRTGNIHNPRTGIYKY